MHAGQSAPLLMAQQSPASDRADPAAYKAHSAGELTSEELLREFGGGMWQMHASSAAARPPASSGEGLGRLTLKPEAREAVPLPVSDGYWQTDAGAAAAAAMTPGGSQHHGNPDGAVVDSRWGWQQEQLRSDFMWQNAAGVPPGGATERGAQLTQVRTV